MSQQFSSPATGSRRYSRRWAVHFFVPLGCALLCVAVVVPWMVRAGSGEGGFDGVVNSLESRYHAHATRIPMMFLASMVAGGATHGGVGGLHVAEFEHFSAPVDGEDLNRMVEEKLGHGWERMIRETSRHGGEQTLIFAHPDGKRMALFILDLDGQELDVVQVSVDPDLLNETIHKYEHHDRGGEASD